MSDRMVQGVGKLGNATTINSEGKKKSAYFRWHGMLRRCYNPKNQAYGNYGGRGIKVCDRWLTFSNYEEDIKNLSGFSDKGKTTLDRLDNDADYSPSNCRWATKATQTSNRRKDKRRRSFIAISPSGREFTSDNQSKFAQINGLNVGSLNKCLHGGQKTHKGWKFQFASLQQ